MAVYRITKIEENQPEKTVVLSENDFDCLLESLQVYDGHLEDSQPMYDDSPDYEEWADSLYAFESLDDKIMKFIHSPKLLIE